MEPITVSLLGTLAVQAVGRTTDINLCSLLAAVIGNRADAFAMDSYDRIRSRLVTNGKTDPQAGNHHLARGTTRAALLAVMSCVDRILESSDAEAFSGKEDRAPKYIRNQLASLIADLECADARRGRSVNRRKFENALVEGSLLLSPPDLDHAAADAMGMQNPRTSDSSNSKISEPKTFTGARQGVLPGIDEAVITQVLKWGGYKVKWGGYKERDKESVTAVIRQVFFGPDEHWLNDFGHFYAAELRQDTQLYRLVTIIRSGRLEDSINSVENDMSAAKALWEEASKSYSGLDDRLAHLNRNVKDLQDTLEDLRASFEIDGNTVFVGYGTKHQTRAKNQGVFSPFHFANEEDAYIGRDSELDDINTKFLDTNEEFAWMAICGDAATGKSRLALQLLNENSARWRLSGFVRSTIIKNVELFIKSGKQIQDPALFVVDYAGNAPKECVNFIEHCASLARSSRQKIRVIVLVRRPSDQFFDEVKDSDGHIVAATVVPFEYGDNRNLDSQALLLAPLSATELVQLMRARMRSSENNTESANDDMTVTKSLGSEQLLEHLDYFDPKRRPLFAAMVADALQRDALQEDQLAGNQENARLRLFWEYLELQYKRRWRYTHEGPLATIDQHLTFAMLSTMCSGLAEGSWEKLREDDNVHEIANALLPAHEDDFSPTRKNSYIEEGLIESIIGSSRSLDDSVYPTLEPDLIGESLILLAHSDGAKRVCGKDKHVAIQRRKNLSRLAWAADPEGAASFAVRVAEDFPEHARKLDWLLPATPDADGAVATSLLLRNLASILIDPFHHRPVNVDDLERINELVDRFDFSSDLPEQAIRNYAEALGGLSEQVGFIINKSVAPRQKFEPVAIESARGSPARSSVEDMKQAGKEPANSSGGHDQATDEFDAAALSSVDDGAEIYRHRSDAATVTKALTFLQRVFELADQHVFSDFSFEVRVFFAEVARNALISLLWDDRNKEKKFGFATTAMTLEEKEARKQFGDKIERELSANLNDETVAIAAYLIYIMLYAEQAQGNSRGGAVYSAIHELIETDGFHKAITCEYALHFLGNYSIVLQTDDDKDVARSELVELQSTSQKLAELALAQSDLDAKDRPKIVGAYCNATYRALFVYRERELEAAALFAKTSQSYLEFGTQYGFDPIRTDTIDMFCIYLDTADKADAVTRKFAERLAEIAHEHGFFGYQFNQPHWQNLQFTIYKFSSCSPCHWPPMLELLRRMIGDIGKRARDDLTVVLKQHVMQDFILADHAIELVDLASADGTVDADLRLVVFSAALRAGLDEWVDADIDRWWVDGDLPQELESRILALHQYSYLLRWRGMQDGQVVRLRKRLVDLLKAERVSSSSELSVRQLQREHDSAVANCASMVAKIEVADGQFSDDWITQKGVTQ